SPTDRRAMDRGRMDPPAESPDGGHAAAMRARLGSSVSSSEPAGTAPALRKEEADMGFVQVIEYKTSKPDEIESVVDEWRSKTEGRRTARRGTLTRDRK